MSVRLGAEMIGLYQISLSVLILLFTLTAGAPTVLSRKIAEAKGENDDDKANSLASASLLIGLISSVTITILCFACHNHLHLIFADDRCVDIFLLMLPALLSSTLFTSIRSWFWGQKRFLAFSASELLDEILKICFAIIFAGGLIASLNGAKGVALAVAISDIICLFVLLIAFFVCGGRLRRPQGGASIIRATIPLSTTRIVTSLITSISALLLPKLLIDYGMSTSLATAEYGRLAGMAFPLIMAPITIVSALSIVLIPDIAEHFSKGETELIKTKLNKTLTFAVLVSSIFFVLYLPLGRQIGSLLFNDPTSGTIVSRCAIMIFPISIMQATTPVLNSMKKEKYTMLSTLSGALFIVPCILIFSQYIGIYSLALGTFSAFFVTSIVNIIMLKKMLGSVFDFKKTATIMLFSLGIAISALFMCNLCSNTLGDIVSILVIGFYILFFMFIFIDAFKIVDVVGYARRIDFKLPKFLLVVSKTPKHLKTINHRKQNSEQYKHKKQQTIKSRMPNNNSTKTTNH